MARQARIKSELGIYLVNLKSVEDVCFSKEDKEDFLNVLLSNEVWILGYTLFNNSFVFVLREDERSIDVILRQNSIKFVKNFNRKHRRVGKVFAGRYTSYSAQTMLDVWTFVSNTHTMRNVDNENINSYENYFENKYINSEYALNYFESKEKFYEQCSGLYLSEDGIKLSDDEVKNYIINNFQIQPSNIEKMPESLLQNVIGQVFRVTKASARQIARITSLPLRFLWNIAKKIKGEKKKESVLYKERKQFATKKQQKERELEEAQQIEVKQANLEEI